MAIEKPKKLTNPQRKALENLAAGRHSSDGLRGQSEHGGHHSVVMCLTRRGWTEWHDGYLRITDAGRKVLSQ